MEPLTQQRTAAVLPAMKRHCAVLHSTALAEQRVLVIGDIPGR
jgi:hypothetical protein